MPSNNKASNIGYSEKSTMPPLGIFSIGNYLKMHGIEVHYIDMLSRPITKEDFAHDLNTIKPDLIGISTYTETFNAVKTLSRFIKSVLPSSTLVLGGPHVTFMPEESLAIPEVDFVMSGEGEPTFAALIESLNYQTIPLSEVRGIHYKVGETHVQTVSRGFVEPLDALPFIDIDPELAPYYKIKQLIITSRGCPGKCIYCASAALSGRRYRARSAENVFSEMAFKKAVRGERYFAFIDDTFTAHKRRFQQICHYMKKSNLDIKWRCDSRADILTRDMIDDMKNTGCVAVHIGIESGDQNIIKQISKEISLEYAESLIAYLHDQNIQVMCSFIIGHHCDTHDTIQKTIQLAEHLKNTYDAHVALGVNTPFPGTELYKNREALKVKLETTNWSSYDLVQPVISTEHVSREELQHYMFTIQQREI